MNDEPGADLAPGREPAPEREHGETIAAIVDRWHFENFHGSAAARDVEVWNLLYAAKEDLKRRLAAYQKEI